MDQQETAKSKQSTANKKRPMTKWTAHDNGKRQRQTTTANGELQRRTATDNIQEYYPMSLPLSPPKEGD